VMDVQLRPFQDDGKTGLVVDLTLAAGPSSLYTWSAEETALDDPPDLPQDPTVYPYNHNWTPNLTNVTRDGGTFTKTGGTDATWNDAGFYSSESHKRFVVGFTVAQTGTNLVIGADASPSSDNHYTSMDFGIALDGIGSINDPNEAHSVVGGSFSSGQWDYVVGDRFEMIQDGFKVRWYQNGVLLHTEDTSFTARGLDGTFYHMDASVDDLVYGPVEGVGTGQLDLESVDEVAQDEEASSAAISLVSGTQTAVGPYVTMEVEETTDVIDLIASGTILEAVTGVDIGVINDSYFSLAYRESPSGSWIEFGQPIVGEGASAGGRFEAEGRRLAMNSFVTGLTPDTYDFGVIAYADVTAGGSDPLLFSLINGVATGLRIKR
jgi:hypothetical protein